MEGYWQLLPELIVIGIAITALFGDLIPGKDRGTALLGAAASTIAAVVVLFWGTAEPLFGGMVVADETARFIRIAVAGLTAVWLLWLAGRDMAGERRREAVALALFSSAGGMILAMSADLIMLYMALELSTMPAYVLMGYKRSDIDGLEGALKYFLLSMLTSLVMLYGLSFIYGLSGTTAYSGISLADTGALGIAAAALVMVGLFAKMSAAPFHYWAPDAYAGAPASSVAFVSTVPKISGMAAIVRLVAIMAPDLGSLGILLGAGAVLSMVLGNLAALPQSDLRRLMAYSGVAHTGYLLLALTSGTDIGYGAVLFYVVAYAAPSMAIMLVSAEEGSSLTDFAGLAARRPVVAWAMVVWLLSLIGIPPFAGFFGKLYLFGAAIDGALVWQTVLAIVMSVVSAGYYFRVIREIFFGDAPESPAEVERSIPASAALALCVLATVAIGLGASPLMQALGFSFP